MDDYLTKPLKAGKLADVLARWIPQEPLLENNQGDGLEHEQYSPESQSQILPKSENGQEKSPQPEREKSSGSYQEVSPIDPEVLEGMQSLVGPDNPDFLSKVLGQFVQEATHCVEAIQHAVEQGDRESLIEAAHGLKGICGNIGAQGLAERALRLEQVAKEGMAVPPRSNNPKNLEAKALGNKGIRRIVAPPKLPGLVTSGLIGFICCRCVG